MAEIPAAPTISGLRLAFGAGLDPQRVIAEVYRRIAAANDPGIFISLVPQARASAMVRSLGRFDPAAKPLWGVPFAVKDNIDVAGMPTTAACPDFAYTPPANAAAVERLVAAGAIPIGKTNLDQFATGLAGVRTPHPAPKNPFDPAMAPGGSSSGSAVAVARGLVAFALGSDTAGSGRVPAGLNNIVGLKPTLGAISARGMVPACRTLDCVSIFALTVDDAFAVYRAAAGFDPQDAYSKSVMPGSPGAVPKHLRVGVPDRAGLRFGGDRLAEQVFAAALRDLEALGAEIVALDFAPFFAAAELLYAGPWVAERYQAIRDFIERRPEALHPVTRQVIAAAVGFSAADAFAGFYRLAELRRATEGVWRSVDMLAVPTFPRPRTLADLTADPIGPNSELGTYTNFVNLLDLCALAVPGRFRGDRFPAGITVIAPAGGDARLAAIGAALHDRAAVPLGATGEPQPTR